MRLRYRWRKDRRGMSPLRALLLVVMAALVGLLAVEIVRTGRLSPASVTWFVLLGVAMLLYVFSLDREQAPAVVPEADVSEAGPHPAPPEEIDEAILSVMKVENGGMQRDVPVAEGRLLMDPDTAFEKLEADCGAFGYQPTLQPLKGDRVRLALIPREHLPAPVQVKPLLHWALFLATLATTTYIGGQIARGNPADGIDFVLKGLPYSLGLLVILGLHELGHYFTARRHRMSVTPPYFIPFPGGLGTFGAFIQMRSPSRTRSSLFDVAVAGPLAGLLPTIPVLVMGFKEAQIIPPLARFVFNVEAGTLQMSSLLMHLVGRAVLGPVVDSEAIVLLGPLGFAGYLGLFVTALNLLPIGQLDGGHIARAMFGHKAGAIISAVAMAALFLTAATVRQELLPWAMIVFFLAAARPAPPLNEVSRVGPGRMALGVVSFVILGLILCPAPN